MKINTSLMLAVSFFSLTLTTLQAQIAINNTAANPDASAILDLNSGNTGNKGFLAPQVTLASITDAATIPNPATGIIVYNKTAAGITPNNVVPGYYYNSGTPASPTWVLLLAPNTGSAGQVLTSNGGGAPSWTTPAGTLSGSGINNYVARWTPNSTTLGAGKIQDNGSSVGINGAPGNAILYTNSTRAAGDSSLGATYGVYANTTDATGAYSGVYAIDANGIGLSTSGGTYGVYAVSTSNITGFGAIFGEDNNTNAYGVEGSSTNGDGVKGIGGSIGVYGNSGAGGIGVYGVDNSTYGVEGYSLNGSGVYGYSNNNTGVYGQGGTYGGNFTASAGAGVNSTGTTYGGNFTGSGGPGVYGSGTNFGGQFTASAGAGVYGTGSYGVYGSGTIAPGLYGVSTRAAGDSAIGKTYGVYGYTTGAGLTTAGVYGKGTTYGVYGSATGIAVYGNSSGSTGVFGLSSTVGSAGVYGYGNVANVYGVEGQGNGVTMPAIPANTGNAFCGTDYGLFAAQTNAVTTGVAAIYAQDAFSGDYVQLNAWSATTHYKANSNIGAGSYAGAAIDLSGQKVLLHCPETPEFYYEDYGEGQLVNGKAHIDLDPILAKNVAISAKHPLRVFIQLEDNETCKGVIVKNKSGSGFDVVELDGGTSNTPFEWHVVCNVKDADDNGTINHVQDLRFEKAPLPVYPAKN